MEDLSDRGIPWVRSDRIRAMVEKHKKKLQFEREVRGEGVGPGKMSSQSWRYPRRVIGNTGRLFGHNQIIRTPSHPVLLG